MAFFKQNNELSNIIFLFYYYLVMFSLNHLPTHPCVKVEKKIYIYIILYTQVYIRRHAPRKTIIMISFSHVRSSGESRVNC